jgi:type VI secretion system protein ImpH
MQATKRKHESSVIGLLLDEPHRFEFTQLLNLLLRDLRRQGIPYERAFREVLSFRNSLSLSFPASEVQAIDIEPKTQDAFGAMRAGQVRRIRVTPAFIGLLGASGTLPLHDTERIAARKAHDGDASQHELLDVLSNRLIGLFYEASGKYRVEHGLDVHGHDLLLPILTSLSGARSRPPSEGEQPVGRVRQETAAYFAGLLRTRPVSASTVEQVLTAYFDVPIRLEQFVGCWDPIPENRRSTLGTKTPVLGYGAALGVRLWRHDLSARLHIGPLDEAQAQGFLPGGRSLEALEEMASLFAVPTLRYEVRLLLAPPCVKRLTLSTRAAPRQLGWNTFLTGTPGVTSRPDIRSALRLPGRTSANRALTPGLAKIR